MHPRRVADQRSTQDRKLGGSPPNRRGQRHPVWSRKCSGCRESSSSASPRMMQRVRESRQGPHPSRGGPHPVWRTYIGSHRESSSASARPVSSGSERRLTPEILSRVDQHEPRLPAHQRSSQVLEVQEHRAARTFKKSESSTQASRARKFHRSSQVRTVAPQGKSPS